jgi:glycosyltransferase involved in cell wall biosynthesis
MALQHWKASGLRIFVLATRADASKNLDDLLVKIRDFLLENQSWRFAFAGIVNDSDHIRWRSMFSKAGLESKVELMGVVSSVALRQLFQLAQASIWPSISIGIIHSLACGCPVVISSDVSYSHFLLTDENGAIYESGEIAEALLKFNMINPSKRQVSSSVASLAIDHWLLQLKMNPT